MGEKPNYGKIGRRRRLSKLNVFFFHNSVGDHTGIIPEKSHYQFSIIVILAISLIWINGLFLWHYFSGMIHRDFWEY
jgi:hypothetical protein